MTLSIDDDAEGLGTILASIPEFVILVDRDRVIRYINRVEPGYDRDQVLGAPVETFVAGPEDVFNAALNGVLATGEAEEFEIEVILPDGSKAWYRSNMVPYREGADIVGAVIVAANITELKAAQETLARLQQLLPICAWCRRIRNDDGGWESMESYLGKQEGKDVTHGICSECHEKQLKGLDA